MKKKDYSIHWSNFVMGKQFVENDAKKIYLSLSILNTNHFSQCKSEEWLLLLTACYDIQGRITCANVLSDLYAMGVVHCDNMLTLLGVPKDCNEKERDVVVSLFLNGFKVNTSYSFIFIAVILFQVMKRCQQKSSHSCCTKICLKYIWISNHMDQKQHLSSRNSAIFFLFSCYGEQWVWSAKLYRIQQLKLKQRLEADKRSDARGYYSAVLGPVFVARTRWQLLMEQYQEMYLFSPRSHFDL